MSKDAVLYKVRNKYREVIATESKSKLLRHIASGRFSGDEEIAAPPYLRWHKFSAHPVFYDAFLKRLHSDRYQSPEPLPEGEAEPSREEAAGDFATRQAAHDHAEREDPGTRRYDGATGHVADARDFGATVHQSDIDELFADDSREVPAQEPVYGLDEEPAGTEILPLEEDLAGESTVHARTALTNLGEPTLPGVSLPKAEPQTKPVNRRLLLYAGVGVLLVVLLMSGGEPSESDKVPFKAESAQSGISPIRQLISGSADVESQVEALLEEGDLLATNDSALFYRGALEAYREAESLGGGNAKIFGRIAETGARLLLGGGNPDEFRDIIRSSMKRGRALDPHNSAFYRTEALLHLFEGSVDKARDSIYNALEADPGNSENLLVLGEVQFARGELAEASRSFQDSLKVNPQGLRARYFLAKVALDLGNLARAREEALEALRLNALHSHTYLMLADVAIEQNQVEEAIGLYETCGRLARFGRPTIAADAYLRLGRVRELTGDRIGAERAFRLAYHYDPNLEGLGPKVKGLNLDARALADLASDEEYDSNYFSEQGEDLLRQNKLNEAVRFFQAAYLLDRRNAAALVRLGEVTGKTADSYDDYKRVMNLYQRAIERNPTAVDGYVQLGLLETEQYNLDRALVILRQAEAIAPESPEVYVALGKHFYKRQDYNEALGYFLKAAKLKPTDSEVLYYAGKLRLLFKKDSARDAVKFFYQSYSLDPNNYDALMEWLKLKVLGYEKNFAIKFVRNLLEQDPGNANLYWVLGEVYAANKEFRRAISYYHKALDLDNRNSKFRMSLARALEAVGDLPKATAEYRLASLLDRKNSDGFYKAADLLYRIKDYNSSEKVIKFLISVTPNYPGAHRYLSLIYREKGKKDLAIEEMEKEVANNPENYKFTLELAQLYMEYTMYEKAVDQLKKVTNLPRLVEAPEFVYDKIRAYLLLSRAYRALSKPESSEAAIKLALEIDPSDPELHRELGYVYYALQRDKEGVAAFEYYLKRQPAAQDAKDIEKLIKKMRIEQ